MRRTNSIAGDCYHVGMQAQGLPSFSHVSNPEIHIFMLKKSLLFLNIGKYLNI